MSPRARKKAAGVALAVSILGGWPASFILPRLEGPFYEIVLMFVSMLALSLTLGNIFLTTDVRAEGAGED